MEAGCEGHVRGSIQRQEKASSPSGKGNTSFLAQEGREKDVPNREF